VKRLSDTLTYRGIASEAVFTDPPVAESLKLSYYYYWPPYWKISNRHISATGHPIDFMFGSIQRERSFNAQTCSSWAE